MASKKAQELELNAGVGSVGSLIADAIREAANLGEATARASWKPVMASAGVASDTEEWYLQQLAPEVPAELVKVARRPVAVTSSHSGVQSFTDWVSRRSGEAGPTPEVFVGKEAVQAKWNMDNHGPKDSAALPLVACESWKALQQLIAGVGQKELHKLLTTSLFGCIGERLALQISLLSHYVQQNCDVAIARTGLADVAISERLSLRFTGGGEDQTEEIGVEWTYTGPVWTCYDAPISVPLRMVISKEKDAGLRFEFAPLGLEALMLAYRRGLADDVADGLGESGIPVYVGSVN